MANATDHVEAEHYPTAMAIKAGYMLLRFPGGFLKFRTGRREVPADMKIAGVQVADDGSFGLSDWDQFRAFFRAFPDDATTRAYAEMYVDPFADDPIYRHEPDMPSNDR